MKATFEGWAGDDRSFLVATTARDERYFDLYGISVDGYKSTLLYRNTEGFDIGPVSRDQRYVALVKPRTTNDADIFLHDRKTGTTKNITSHAGNVNNFPADFSPDGSKLLFDFGPGPRVRRASELQRRLRRRLRSVCAALGHHRGQLLQGGQAPGGLRQRGLALLRTPARQHDPGASADCRCTIGHDPWHQPVARRHRHRLLRQQWQRPQRPLRRPADGSESNASDQRAEPVDRAGGPGRSNGRALQVLRWPRDSGAALQTAPGLEHRQGARSSCSCMVGRGGRRRWVTSP